MIEENIKKALKANKGKMYSVTFEKANGDLRKMVCLDGVKKHLVKNPLWSPKKNEDVHRTFDMHIAEYRSFRYDRLVSMKISGQVFNIQ